MHKPCVSLVGLVLALGALHASADHSIPAPDGYAVAQNDETVFIDIRRPEEWHETGVAEGAELLSLEKHPQGPQGFLRDLIALADGDPTQSITLICRTGNRTGMLQEILQESGFTNVHHIGEGMMGSDDGPGWLDRELPVRQFE